jgi:hypothetical protein
MHMNWYTKYHMPVEFAAYFLSEQEYVDHMFIWLIYANFGVLLSTENLLVTA